MWESVQAGVGAEEVQENRYGTEVARLYTCVKLFKSRTSAVKNRLELHNSTGAAAQFGCGLRDKMIRTLAAKLCFYQQEKLCTERF
jgi:hypothetical protein